MPITAVESASANALAARGESASLAKRVADLEAIVAKMHLALMGEAWEKPDNRPPYANRFHLWNSDGGETHWQVKDWSEGIVLTQAMSAGEASKLADQWNAEDKAKWESERG